MSNIRNAIYTRLTSVAGITSLIDKKVYPTNLPQNITLPAVTFQLLAEDEIETLQTPATMRTAAVQFDCYAATQAAADAVAEAIRTALKNYSGTAASTDIEACRKINKMEMEEKDKDGKIVCYRTMLEYRISYQE